MCDKCAELEAKVIKLDKDVDRLFDAINILMNKTKIVYTNRKGFSERVLGW